MLHIPYFLRSRKNFEMILVSGTSKTQMLNFSLFLFLFHNQITLCSLYPSQISPTPIEGNSLHF